MPRQVTLVWTLDQLLLQNAAAITRYNLNCSSISSNINTTATTVNITAAGIGPFTNYTCTLTALSTSRVHS